MVADDLYLNKIHTFLDQRFREIFGDETMSAEPVMVYNDSNAPCPMLVTNQSPIRIRLAQESLAYWAQTIYQLSHEMCHYAIRQHKADKGFTLSWFEEIVCGAASLYFLDYSAANWSRCELVAINPKYDIAIRRYLNNELMQATAGSFQECASVEKLRAYERVAEEDRCGHRAERNHIFHAVTENPLGLRSVVHYDRYVKENRISIDFERWLAEDDNCIIRAFAKVVPVQ